MRADVKSDTWHRCGGGDVKTIIWFIRSQPWSWKTSLTCWLQIITDAVEHTYYSIIIFIPHIVVAGDETLWGPIKMRGCFLHRHSSETLRLTWSSPAGHLHLCHSPCLCVSAPANKAPSAKALPAPSARVEGCSWLDLAGPASPPGPPKAALPACMEAQGVIGPTSRSPSQPSPLGHWCHTLRLQWSAMRRWPCRTSTTAWRPTCRRWAVMMMLVMILLDLC